MNIFIDTSAFLAILDGDDLHHISAKEEWEKIVSSESNLICHNYILLETLALVQHRFGIEAVRVFEEDILPIVTVEWIGEIAHKSGVAALLAASKRRLSLVDCVSFETMRHSGTKIAFTFDPHFHEQGFKCIP